MGDSDSDSSTKTVVEKTEARKMSNHFIGNIEHFTPGDDFDNYIERVEELLKLNKVEDGEKVSFLVGICGADLYKIMKSVIAPKATTDCTFAQLKKALKEYFDPKRNVIGERFAFHRRQQKSDESVADYIMEIKTLSRTCEFGQFLDEALRDKLIFGLHDVAIQRKLANTKNLDFETACSTAKLMETTEQNLNDMKHTDGNVAMVRNRYGYNGAKPKGKNVFARLSGKIDDKSKRGRTVKCFLCQKMGHMVRDCYKNPSRNARGARTDSGRIKHTESEEDGLNYINNVLAAGPVFMEVSVNNILIKMELDTGACRTVMHRRDQQKFLPRVKLRKCEKVLFSVSGQRLQITGMCTVRVKHKNEMLDCDLIIVDSERNFIPLLGRDWLDVLYPNWRAYFSVNAIDMESKHISGMIDCIRKKFATVFSNISGGTIRDFTIDLEMDKDATPIFYKPYTVPYGLRGAAETEIKRLCDMGIIYPVRNSKWASPVVIVSKPDGSIRMCVDCKVTINKFLKTDHYPLPRIDDILAALAGAKYFCILDLREAFAQLAVSEDSQEYLTINTHLGLYRYRRLIFGVACAPTKFQSTMDRVIQGLKGVLCFIDDLLIGGNSLEECYANLIAVLDRLVEYNVKIKWEKCKFFQTSVTYLGHEISEEGIRPNKEKIKAVVNAPAPQNLTQVKSYLGLINYYGRFIPNLSSELIELYKLTKKGVNFVWTDACQTAFERSKQLLLDNDLLAHYDPNKQIVVHCDASPYGLGAILSHVIDGVDRPVLFASCTLTDAQKNYSQLQREALSVVFAVKKFHKYIFGKQITIYNDHQPLREIFNERKSVPVAAGQLQRWAIFLSMYNYRIEYKKGSKMGNADALSRLPLSEENDIDAQNVQEFSESMPIDRQVVIDATRADQLLCEVMGALKNGWPNSMSESLTKFHNKRLLLSIESETLFYGNRMIIPENLKLKILNLLHDTHIGVCRMKAAARMYVWWPRIDSDIEEYAKRCEPCQLNQSTPSSTGLSKWTETSYFFERIHLDFFHWNGQTFLIVVDSYSRWLDVKLMPSTKCDKVIDELRVIFAYFGLPCKMVADNGPPFNAKELRAFCNRNGIHYMNSPPYHPQSNGWAECGVRTVKSSLKKMLIESGKGVNSKLLLARFLIKYRNTPVTTTNQTPSDRIFLHRPRILMHVLTCKQTKGTEVKRIEPNQSHTTTQKTYKIGEMVVYRNEFKNDTKWLKARILKVLSKCRYTIQLLSRGSIRDCHGDQLRPFCKSIFDSQLPTRTPICQERFEEEQFEPRAEEDWEQQQQPGTSIRRNPGRTAKREDTRYRETRIRPLKPKKPKPPILNTCQTQ